MAKQVVLDAGPLGMITHPRPNREIADWFKQMLRPRSAARRRDCRL